MTDTTLPREKAGGSFILVARLIVIGAIIGFWQLAPIIGIIDVRLLPPPVDVLGALIHMLGEAEFRAHVWQTLAETGVAFLIAVPSGFVFAVIIGERPFLSEMLKPLVFFVFSIPKSIFLPLFIFVFGITFQQKVAFGVFSTVFIVIIIGFAAMESVRREHVLVARSCGATRWQAISRVYLPSMTPVLLECVRVAMIFNFTGILLAEMYASRTGLGNVIGAWGQAFQLERLMAGIVLVAFLSILFNEAIRMFERKCEHWRE